MLRAKTRLDSQGLEHLKTLLWLWFFLDKDIFVNILWNSHSQFMSYIAIHPLFVQPSASFSHFVRKDQILAQCCCWFSLDTIASPVSLVNQSSGGNNRSPVRTHARGCRRGLSTPLASLVLVGCPGWWCPGWLGDHRQHIFSHWDSPLPL